MKLAHNVKISVFCHEGENAAAIKSKLSVFLPFDLEKEKIAVKESKAEGFHDRPILIFEVFVEKERLVNEFLENLKGKLSDDAKKIILKQAESRTDDECRFFLRFDKDKILSEDKLWLTDSGNCYHITITVAAFPKKKERAVAVVKEMFGSS